MMKIGLPLATIITIAAACGGRSDSRWMECARNGDAASCIAAHCEWAYAASKIPASQENDCEAMQSSFDATPLTTDVCFPSLHNDDSECPDRESCKKNVLFLATAAFSTAPGQCSLGAACVGE